MEQKQSSFETSVLSECDIFSDDKQNTEEDIGDKLNMEEDIGDKLNMDEDIGDLISKVKENRWIEDKDRKKEEFLNTELNYLSDLKRICTTYKYEMQKSLTDPKYPVPMPDDLKEGRFK